ncbi:MAG: nucleotidyltransferase family protein [Thermoanaerobaculia bacterium]
MQRLGEPAVAAAGLAALAALRDGSAAPLEAFAADDARARTAAFAASLQGLGPRLARLPDVAILAPSLRDHLAGEGERCAARGERILGLLASIEVLLASSGLRAVPLKGAALVLGKETPAGLRPMADLDLLFDSEADLRVAAAKIGAALGYASLWNTKRHLVLAEREERVPFPACEHPGNPLRIELHRSFRLEVLGSVLDATDALRRDTAAAGGWALPSREALLRHLLFHAAEDFAAKGLRGVQAFDFVVLARRNGPLPVPDLARGERGPVVLAARAVERLFPATFDAASLARTARGVSSRALERAAELPVLRHARPERGWTATALGLTDGTLRAARFLVRTLLPSLDEVKANVAPDASGPRLAAAWASVLTRRLSSAVRRLARR